MERNMYELGQILNAKCIQAALTSKDILENVKTGIINLLKTKPGVAGKGISFSKKPEKGKENEDAFRHRLEWLRCVQLDPEWSFICLRAEARLYYELENRRIQGNADLIGIARGKTTRLSVVELKYGKNKDSLCKALLQASAYAWNLSKISVALAGFWDKDSEASFAWASTNPFAKLSGLHVAVVADPVWWDAQLSSPVQKQSAKKVCEMIRSRMGISSFSLASTFRDGKAKSKPYALLPLKPIKGLV